MMFPLYSIMFESIGGLYSSGILGVAIDKEASRLVFTLTYDHQISAGKEALLFLKSIRSKLLKKV